MTVETMPRMPSAAPGWGFILIQGIALVLLGLALALSPGMSVLVLTAFLGFYWLIAGTFGLVRMFTREGRAHWGWNLFGGILGILAGIIVLRHPFWSAVLLPTLLIIILGIDALIMGVVNFVRAFSGDGWGAGVLGAVDLIFGFILLGSPLVAAAVLPVVLGIFALIGGIVLIPIAFSVRGESEHMAPGEKGMKAA